MRIGFLLLILFFTTTSAGHAQPKALSEPFDQITSVTPLEDGKLLITQYEGDYKAKIYDPKRDSVLHRFIRGGKGPGESPAIMATHHTKGIDRFTFFSRDQRWIQTDIQGNLIKEKINLLPGVNHICSTSDKTMQLFSSLHIPGQVIDENKPIPAGFQVNIHDLSTEDSLMITPKQLELDEIKSIGRVNSVAVDFIGHRLDEHRLLLTYTGSKHLFLFENGQLKKKIAANIPGNFGIKVVERGNKMGTQAAGVFTHLQQLRNGTLLFSMGNTHQDLPFGAIYVMVSEDDKIMVHHETLYNNFGEVAGGYNHIVVGNKRFWFSEFYFTGFSLYKEELSDEI